MVCAVPSLDVAVEKALQCRDEALKKPITGGKEEDEARLCVVKEGGRTLLARPKSISFDRRNRRRASCWAVVESFQKTSSSRMKPSQFVSRPTRLPVKWWPMRRTVSPQSSSRVSAEEGSKHTVGIEGHIVMEEGTAEERGGLRGYLELLQTLGEVRDGRFDRTVLGGLGLVALLLEAFAPVCPACSESQWGVRWSSCSGAQ